MKTNPLKTLAKNIASAIKTSTRDAKLILLDAKEENAEVAADWERRYQHATQKDLECPQGVYFILFGSPYPSKKGYHWA